MGCLASVAAISQRSARQFAPRRAIGESSSGPSRPYCRRALSEAFSHSSHAPDSAGPRVHAPPPPPSPPPGSSFSPSLPRPPRHRHHPTLAEHVPGMPNSSSLVAIDRDGHVVWRTPPELCDGVFDRLPGEDGALVCMGPTHMNLRSGWMMREVCVCVCVCVCLRV